MPTQDGKPWVPPRVAGNDAEGGGGGGGGGGKRKGHASSPPQPTPPVLYRGMLVKAANGRRTMLFDPDTYAKHRDQLRAVAAAVARAQTAADAKREGAPGWALSNSRACHQCCTCVAVVGRVLLGARVGVLACHWCTHWVASRGVGLLVLGCAGKRLRGVLGTVTAGCWQGLWRDGGACVYCVHRAAGARRNALPLSNLHISYPSTILPTPAAGTSWPPPVTGAARSPSALSEWLRRYMACRARVANHRAWQTAPTVPPSPA